MRLSFRGQYERKLRRLHQQWGMAGFFGSRQIYRALPDDDAATFNWIRVIDESGEDYLFPSSCFIPIELPAEVEQALCATASWGGHLVQPAPQWNVVG